MKSGYFYDITKLVLNIYVFNHVNCFKENENIVVSFLDTEWAQLVEILPSGERVFFYPT